MDILLSDIYVDERLREDYGDISEDIQSYLDNGQLQEVLVRKAREGEETEDKPWVLVDGGRRYRIISEIYKQGKVVRFKEPGYIGATTREDATPLQAIIWEFEANERRKDFTWQERAKYVRRVHQMFTKENEDWKGELTAEVLRMPSTSFYRYLSLTQDPEIFKDPAVQGSESAYVAEKKAKIVKDKKRREREIKRHTEVIDKKLKDDNPDLASGDSDFDVEHARHRIAITLCQHRDAREMVKGMKDGTLDWVHWDPPYGNKGFAHSTHEYFEDSEEYAKGLMLEMFPHIHRVLKDGHWLALWYTPRFGDWVRRALQGHTIGSKGTCEHCGTPLDELDSFKPCKGIGHGFWVNPIPYIWYKPDRQADGHEIRRFSLNQYEPFYLAAKWVDREPILSDSSKSNVLVFNQIPKGLRRHPTHKPPELLADILGRISIAGEVGADFGVGSGSIYEAALPTHRRLIGCDNSEGNWGISLEVIHKLLVRHGITNIKDLREMGKPSIPAAGTEVPSNAEASSA